MKFLRFLLLVNCLGSIFLLGCENRKAQNPVSEIREGSAPYFYNLGLDTRDPEKKLKLYEAGLAEVENKCDTILVSLLEGKVYALSVLGELDRSEKWIDSLIEVAELQKDTFYIAKGYYRKSRLYSVRNKPEKEFENAFIARRLNLLSGDSSVAARRSLDMASAQYEMGDLPGSQESAAEALRYLDNQQDSIFISAAHNIVGLAYLDLGLNENAVEEYRHALKFAAREKDSLTFLHNIALAYKNEKKYDEALEILEAVVHSDAPDEHSKSRYIDNLAFTLWLKDSTAKVDTLLFKALKMREASNDLEGMQTNYFHLAEYFQNKDKNLATDYARKSLEAARKNSSSALEVMSLKKLIELVDGPEEKKYVDRYITLHDSLDRASAKAKFYFAKVRFDENHKQEQISSLERQNFRQTLEAERLRTRNINNLLIILMLLLIGAILAFYSVQRSRREKIRQIYFTERRISKKIHDELANDVYNLMSSLEEISNKEAVDRLEHIYRRTRDISRENADIETGPEFGSALVSMLSHNTGKSRLVLRGEANVPWEKLSEEKKVVVYRVLQELMVNMRKHSGAHLVAITFSKFSNRLEINYSDTGRGANLQVVERGNGLQNVKTRIASVHGKIKVKTEKNKGFEVRIIIPI